MKTARAITTNLAVLAVLASPGAARAEDAIVTTLSTLERVTPSTPRAPMSLAMGGGYGYTEAVLGRGDAHHRLSGALAVEAAPLSWLGLGLRLDGRYDTHSVPGSASDSGLVGDPRLFARLDRPVGADTSLGARATIWLPGAKAPSLEPGATTVDAVGLFSWQPGHGATTLSANAGYRIDRSSHSAGDAGMLSAADRVALNVSAFNAVLAGAAIGHRMERWELHGEWSWQMLVGSGAPSASESPMLVGAGARAALSRAWAAELMAEAAVSSRPDPAATAPLAPIPPRFSVLAGLSARFDHAPPPPPSTPTPAPAVELAHLDGQIGFEGPVPPETTVTVRAGGREVTATADAGGRFSLGDLPPGPAQVTASAPGYEPATAQTVLGRAGAANVQITLKRKLPVGQIRGTVRSFGGKGLGATVHVAPAEAPPEDAGREVRADDGSFQLDVRPGEYRVTIEANGYEKQQRNVRVEENGVTVLNVDLRRGR